LVYSQAIHLRGSGGVVFPCRVVLKKRGCPPSPLPVNGVIKLFNVYKILKLVVKMIKSGSFD
jgi:hypothetical protein